MTQDRLLTDEEVGVLKTGCMYPVGDEGRIGKTGVESRAKFYSVDNKKLYKSLTKAQDAKTASIVRAEVEKEFELKFNPDYLDFKKGVIAGKSVILGWLNDFCEHEVPPIIRRACDICWQEALRAECQRSRNA